MIDVNIEDKESRMEQKDENTANNFIKEWAIPISLKVFWFIEKHRKHSHLF